MDRTIETPTELCMRKTIPNETTARRISDQFLLADRTPPSVGGRLFQVGRYGRVKKKILISQADSVTVQSFQKDTFPQK